MKRESGATMVEYTLLVALIGIAVVVSVMFFRGGITGSLEKSTDCLESVGGGGDAADCPGVGSD